MLALNKPNNNSRFWLLIFILLSILVASLLTSCSTQHEICAAYDKPIHYAR